ncbi:MAG: group II intron reverse transcriptase/maturase [Enterococcus avium]
MKEGKSFRITQNEVLLAYKRVKANKGAGGIDGLDLHSFEKDWKNRLYKLWNRMSSGSYFPKAVRGVEIPKKNGKMRLLGIPTIEDRIAQMVVRNRIEPNLEKLFLEDSYGYRPNKSALDAIGVTRTRCFNYPWIVEFDIVGLFDFINHEKLLDIVKRHTKEKWILLYIQRFLTAPIQLPNGKMRERDSGTPQGGVISPILANVYMHYAFDLWMKTKFPEKPWARYADDGLIHCATKQQATHLMRELTKRMKVCLLEIHPEKSKIVYCRNDKIEEENNFEFLGYSFRNRLCKNRYGVYFTGFTPAVSKSAVKNFKNKIREGVKEANTTSLICLSEILNPIIRGWMNYFMKFNKSEAIRKGIKFEKMQNESFL